LASYGVLLSVIILTLALVSQYIGWLSAAVAIAGLSVASTGITYGAIIRNRRSAETALSRVVELRREGRSDRANNSLLVDTVASLPFTEQLRVFRKIINILPYSEERIAYLQEHVPLILREFENLVSTERLIHAVDVIASPR
jgi:hypothetical protein